MTKETINLPNVCVGCATRDGLNRFKDNWNFTRSKQSGGNYVNENLQSTIHGFICGKCSSEGKSALNKVGGKLLKIGLVIMLIGLVVFALFYFNILTIPALASLGENDYVIGAIIVLIGLSIVCRGTKNKVSSPQKWFYKVTVNNQMEGFIHFKNAQVCSIVAQERSDIASQIKNW